MNNFSSRKITFGQNLTNQNKISSDDKSTCEGRANKTFIEEERNSPPSAIGLEKWLHLWSKTPHNPYSNNGCDD